MLPPQISQINLFVILLLMLQLYKHSQFFLHCCSNSLRSNNLSANHSEKIVHIQLSPKGNKITGEHHLKADIMSY